MREFINYLSETKDKIEELKINIEKTKFTKKRRKYIFNCIRNMELSLLNNKLDDLIEHITCDNNDDYYKEILEEDLKRELKLKDAFKKIFPILYMINLIEDET
jgi:hypothetical protein